MPYSFCKEFESLPCHHTRMTSPVFSFYVPRSLTNDPLSLHDALPIFAERLAEHNRGYPRGWTSRNRPFELVYRESLSSEKEARLREAFLKSGRGREWRRARRARYSHLGRSYAVFFL